MPPAQHRLPRPLANRLEHSPVERQHGDARYVEGAHRREDEKVRVVERAEVRRAPARLRVVHAERDRRRDDGGGEPRPGQRDKYPPRVGTVLHVAQRSCDGDETARVDSTNVQTPSRNARDSGEGEEGPPPLL